MLRYRNRTGLALIYGVPENYFDILNYVFEIGAGFNREDIRKGAAVGVISARTRRLLFGRTNPLNKIVYWGDLPFLICGVTAEKPPVDEPPGNVLEIFVPGPAYRKRVSGKLDLDMIEARVRDVDSLEETENKIVDFFAARHGRKDVYISDQSASFAAAADQASMIAELLAAVGAISLLIGGIGVMNIMLRVGVRTRARDRRPCRPRRAPNRYSAAVSDRGVYAVPDRRRARRRRFLRLEFRRWLFPAVRLGIAPVHDGDACGGDLRRLHRTCFRLFSRAQRRTARTCGGARP